MQFNHQLTLCTVLLAIIASATLMEAPNQGSESNEHSPPVTRDMTGAKTVVKFNKNIQSKARNLLVKHLNRSSIQDRSKAARILKFLIGQKKLRKGDEDYSKMALKLAFKYPIYAEVPEYIKVTKNRGKGKSLFKDSTDFDTKKAEFLSQEVGFIDDVQKDMFAQECTGHTWKQSKKNKASLSTLLRVLQAREWALTEEVYLKNKGVKKAGEGTVWRMGNEIVTERDLLIMHQTYSFFDELNNGRIRLAKERLKNMIETNILKKDDSKYNKMATELALKYPTYDSVKFLLREIVTQGLFKNANDFYDKKCAKKGAEYVWNGTKCIKVSLKCEESFVLPREQSIGYPNPVAFSPFDAGQSGVTTQKKLSLTRTFENAKSDRNLQQAQQLPVTQQKLSESSSQEQPTFKIPLQVQISPTPSMFGEPCKSGSTEKPSFKIRLEKPSGSQETPELIRLELTPRRRSQRLAGLEDDTKIMETD